EGGRRRARRRLHHRARLPQRPQQAQRALRLRRVLRFLMLLAQISDLHVVAKGRKLFDRVDTPAFLTRAVAHLHGLEPRPDFVWITGDLVDAGSLPEYTNLRAILGTLQIPWALLPGNHDERANLRQAFAAQPYLPRTGEFLHYVVEDLPLRLIALDTVIPGEAGGRLCQARLDWL